MTSANVTSVFGILELVTVTMETAKMAKKSKCSKMYETSHEY